VLPVLNKKVVEYTLKMALATHCQVDRFSRFARKNYFYPDLPKGYQISQYELPIAQHGFVHIQQNGSSKRIGITRIHMEEDAGKLIHDPHRPISKVDFNRTGVPLMEIVSEPDIRTPEEAGAYLRQLRTIVRYLKISDGNLEEGSFRCDANVSIRPKGAEKFGTRAEIKNLNSFKHVEKALYYEIERQKEILLDNGQVVQETRLWDPDKGRTFSMRGKEDAHDYRYFPDPDLLPLVVEDNWIAAIRETLPELPDDKRARFMSAYKLSEYDADLLTINRELADFFEACLRHFNNPKEVSNWITGPLLGLLKSQNLNIGKSPISPKMLAELLDLIQDKTISNKIAKTVFDTMAETGKAPKEIVAEKGLTQVTDSAALEVVIQAVLSRSEKEVAAYKNGKSKLMGYFVGQVMRETKGKANPKIVNEILREKLES